MAFYTIVLKLWVKFSHSPILYYAFSSWIEKKVTKTIIALGNTDLFYSSSMGLCGNFTNLFPEAHRNADSLMTKVVDWAWIKPPCGNHRQNRAVWQNRFHHGRMKSTRIKIATNATSKTKRKGGEKEWCCRGWGYNKIISVVYQLIENV